MRKTKIVCTLGPATDDESIMREIMLAGMNVARCNFSHQDHAMHKMRVDMIKKLRDELKMPLPLLLDTKGPEIRLGLFKNKSVELQKGQKFTLTTESVEGDENRVSVSFKGLPDDVVKGTHILIDDGLIDMIVVEKNSVDILCTVVNGGEISNNKGVNVPGIHVSLPFVSEKDRDDLLFGIENGFDFVAASFTRTAADIIEIRSILENNGGGSIKIIAKIENADGVANINDILRVADGVMVARGDMGVEIPFEEIPRIQKELIKKGYTAGKLVITATQMLDSMMKNPRPTRAETTDVANAIYDGSSAIMLSGETAAGIYPVEAVKTMSRIAERTEADIDYKARLQKRESEDSSNVTNAISHATCTTAYDIGASAIITVTKSGRTARFISKFRPDCIIIGCTPDEQVYRQLNLSWGVKPLLTEEKTSTDELFDHAVKKAVDEGLLKSGDLVVITAGVPLGISGTTNLLKVHIVGDILVSGTGIVHESVCGNLCVCKTERDVIENFTGGDILVIHHASDDILPILSRASGIVAEQGGVASYAALIGLKLGIPVIVGAANATSILKSGTTVTLDGTRGIVLSAGNKQY
jgi:pyruvate kinase